LSKNHDLQQILFRDVVYNDDLNHNINLQYNVKENDDFKSAKIFKIYQDLSYTRGIVYIGSTCDTLSKYMSKFRIKSKSRENRFYDKFYTMICSSYINCKIELIENFPCNNADELIRTYVYIFRPTHAFLRCDNNFVFELQIEAHQAPPLYRP